MKTGGRASLFAFVCCAPIWGVSASAQATVAPATWLASVNPQPSAFSLQPSALGRQQRGQSAKQQNSEIYGSPADMLAIRLNLDGLPDAPEPEPAVAGVLPDAPEPVPPATATGRKYHPERAGAREVTWKSLPRDFLHDQKDIWFTFPGRLATGHHWIPVLAVAGVTTGLIYADPHIMSRRTSAITRRIWTRSMTALTR